MNKIFSLYSFIILGFVFFLFGFSEAGVSDIETAILENDYPKVQQLSQELIDSQPTQKELHKACYYLGLSQMQLGQYEKSRNTFQELLNKNSSDDWRDKAYLGMVDNYHMEEKFQDSLDTLDKLLKVSPKSEYLSLIYLKMARGNLKLAQWIKAKKYLTKIIEEFPHSIEYDLAQQLIQEKHYFAVQVGSFTIRERAENLINELKKKGEYAYIIELTDKDGKKYYRVRVGQFSQLGQAQDLKMRLSQLGYPSKIYP